MGGENIRVQGGMMHEALISGKKEPPSGQTSPRSEGLRAGETYIRRHQGARVQDQKGSERKGGAPDVVWKHRTSGSVSGWHKDCWY